MTPINNRNRISIILGLCKSGYGHLCTAELMMMSHYVKGQHNKTCLRLPIMVFLPALVAVAGNSQGLVS